MHLRPDGAISSYPYVISKFESRCATWQNAGFELPLLAMIKAAVAIPLIASSGAGCPDHFVDVFERTTVEAGLAASIFHHKKVAINDVKEVARKHGFQIRAD